MFWFLASLALAVLNLCLGAAFAIPYADRAGVWLDPALLAAGAAAFMLVPFWLGTRSVRILRVRRPKVSPLRVLAGMLFFWNLAGAAALSALTPRHDILARAQWLPQRLERRGWAPRGLLHRTDDPARAKAVAPVVVRGRLAAAALDLDGLDEEFVESHTRAGATESGMVAYGLAAGLLAANDLKAILDDKEAAGIDKAEMEALAAEHRAFKEKWKRAVDGFEAGQAGTGGRPFLKESLALFKKTAKALAPKLDPAALAESRRRTDELGAAFMKTAAYTTEGPGRVRVDFKPAADGAYPLPMPVTLRLLYEDGRWRSEAHLAQAPKELLELLKQVKREVRR